MQQSIQPRRILFATVPADGHFNPLTGLAVHLKNLGHDVRWYVSSLYAPRLQKLGIHHYGYKKALDVTTYNMDEVFPQREAIKGQVKKLRFDMINFFILRGPEYYQDIQDIYNEFPFEVMFADNTFTGIPFVSDLMKIPVLTVGVMPLTETSKDLAPPGLGLEPAKGIGGKLRNAILRKLTNKFIFGEPNKVMNRVLTSHGIDPEVPSLFDVVIRKSTYLLQSGTPGFEFERSDLSKNVRFIGALLPYQSVKTSSFSFKAEWYQYKTRILVTQGTVEKDPSKLIVPTIEAFRNTDTLVIVTTGGWNTEALRKKYRYDNIVIEDFIPFGEIMPLMDVYVTNGGYGGVMLAIQHRLPMVVAGVHEGKLEINARVNYFKLGVNLKTEKPSPARISKAVAVVAGDKIYKANAVALAAEFAKYDPAALAEKFIEEVTVNAEALQKAVA